MPGKYIKERKERILLFLYIPQAIFILRQVTALFLQWAYFWVLSKSKSEMSLQRLTSFLTKMKSVYMEKYKQVKIKNKLTLHLKTEKERRE